MTKQELANFCIEKIEDKKFQLEKEPLEYTFYKNLLDKYNLKSLLSILNIPPTDIMTAFLGITITDKDFSIILNDVGSFGILLERAKGIEYSYLIDFIEAALRSGTISKIRDYFEESNTIKIRRLFPMPDDIPPMVHDELNDFISFIISSTRDGAVDMSTLLYYCEVYPKKVLYVLKLIVELNKMEMTIPMAFINEDTIGENAERDVNGNIHIHAKKDEINKRVPGAESIIKEFAVIKDHGDSVIANRRKQVKTLEKEIKAYEEFLSEVLKLDDAKEIKNFDVVVEKISDKRLRKEYLKLVFEHNNEEYMKLDSRLNEFKANSSTNYLSLLQEYDIKKDEIDIKLVMRNTLDEVKDILMFLNNITDDKELIIKALETTDIDTMISIKDLVNKGVLDEECLLKNPLLFIKDSDVYKSLLSSIECSHKHSVDLVNISNNPSILINNNLLEDNLTIIENYSLTRGLKSDVDCSFLRLEGLNSKIDKILELGYEDLLEKDLSLLNEDNWDRIYVLKAIGFMPSTKEELINQLRTDTFIVPDSSLDNYIHNVVEYCDKDFKLDSDFMDDYYNSDRTINVNGVILSRQRILRNKDMSFQTLIKGSILSKDEIDILIGELEPKTYKIEG